MLGNTIRDLADSGDAVSPHHLKVLASTLKTCQEGRRTVHQKEQKVSKHVHELRENPAVYESFVQSLVDISARSGGQTHRLKDPHPLGLTIMDAEFDESAD